MEVCDCGARVPEEDGPTHAYLQARPACWRRYGELMVRLLDRRINQPAHVDCYAAQHPGGADTDRRQRQSVAVHLVALCAHLEHGLAEPALLRLRSGVSRTVLPAAGLDDWPWLSPPDGFTGPTAPDLASRGGAGLDAALETWPASVWHDWSAHHDVVRGWTSLALAARRG